MFDPIPMAYLVFSELGTGHAEVVYQRAFEVALRNANVRFESQRDVPVLFMGIHVGRGIADLIVGDVVIELKATSSGIGSGDEAQLINYLKGLSIQRGVIINFGQQASMRAAELTHKWVDSHTQ
jgi:GxxExxY protein